MLHELPKGYIGAGLLEHSQTSAYWTAATVSRDAARGVELEIPYRVATLPNGDESHEQFDQVARWFQPDSGPPINLRLRIEMGVLSFYGCRTTKTRRDLIAGSAFGTVQADDVVLAPREDGDGTAFDAPLRIHQMRSRLDGLDELTRLSAATETVATGPDSRITALNIELRNGAVIRWHQGEAAMSLESTWRSRGPENRRTVEDDVVLVSEFAEPQPVGRHLQEQRHVARLAAVLLTSPIRFRRHEIRDPRFGARRESDGWHGPWHPVVHRSTQADETASAPERREDLPLAQLGEVDRYLSVGPDGLARWFEHAADWERVVLPLMGSFERQGASAEDQAVTAGMCLEAAGHLLSEVEGERDTWRGSRPTAATFVLRVLADLGLQPDGVSASTRGLARAIAHNYNAIKHYDRGRFPDALQTYLCGQIGLLAVRGALLKWTLARADAVEGAEPLLASSAFQQPINRIRQLFDAYGVTINDEGHFVSDPAANGT